MKLPSFFDASKTAAPATTEELAAKVAEAEAAHAAALQSVEEARAALAAERTPKALQAHREAVAEAEDVATMLGILRDDHADAVARDAATERARLAQRLAQLQRETSRQNVIDASRVEAETEAALICQLAECRLRRRAQRDAFKRLEGERDTIARQFGQTVRLVSGGDITEADSATSPVPVVEILRERAEQGSTLLTPFLANLKPNDRSYWPTDHFA